MTAQQLQYAAAILNSLGLVLGVAAAVLLQRSGAQLPAGEQSWGGNSADEIAFRAARRREAMCGWVALAIAALCQFIGTLLPFWD